MPKSRALVDTGPIVSIVRASQSRHRECVDALQDLALPLVTCLPVLTEAAYLLRSRQDEVDALIGSVAAGLITIAPLDDGDLDQVREILRRFADQSFDFADACLMHLADREGLTTVFTIDRKDFSVFRLRNGRSLTIVPTV